MKCKEICEAIIRHYEFITKIDNMDYMRKTDQIFGFVQGCTYFVHDEETYKIVTELWEKLRNNLYANAGIYKPECKTDLEELKRMYL